MCCQEIASSLLHPHSKYACALPLILPPIEWVWMHAAITFHSSRYSTTTVCTFYVLHCAASTTSRKILFFIPFHDFLCRNPARKWILIDMKNWGFKVVQLETIRWFWFMCPALAMIRFHSRSMKLIAADEVRSFFIATARQIDLSSYICMIRSAISLKKILIQPWEMHGNVILHSTSTKMWNFLHFQFRSRTFLILHSVLNIYNASHCDH